MCGVARRGRGGRQKAGKAWIPRSSRGMTSEREGMTNERKGMTKEKKEVMKGGKGMDPPVKPGDDEHGKAWE